MYSGGDGCGSTVLLRGASKRDSDRCQSVGSLASPPPVEPPVFVSQNTFRTVSSEIQIIVLKSIASMAEKHKPIFESYLKSFYVHSTDSSLVKRYKLEILTILANASNISIILREFQVRIEGEA